MKGLASLALALWLGACAPAASQTPSPSATSSAAPTPTATTTASPAPSTAATPTGTPITLPTLANLTAPSGDIVWALVGGTRLFRSNDRGATWQERGVPPSIPIGDIAFINFLEGWLSSPGPRDAVTQCQTQSVTIWNTVDGAATWERVYASSATDVACKGALSFVNAQRGYLALSPSNSSAMVAGSADGGRTWTRSTVLPDPPGFTSVPGASVLIADRARAFGTRLLMSVTGEGLTGETNYAYASDDNGATWRYLASAPQKGDPITFITATRWLQILAPDLSVETTDGGASWHKFQTDYQQAAPVFPQIVFADANVGYATARGSIRRTLDGGAHWTGIKTPGT